MPPNAANMSRNVLNEQEIKVENKLFPFITDGTITAFNS
jgi:hypothetical protein